MCMNVHNIYRLMKEFTDIQNCEAIKKNIFEVSLHEDNLFEWDIKLFEFDDESAIKKVWCALYALHWVVGGCVGDGCRGVLVTAAVGSHEGAKRYCACGPAWRRPPRCTARPRQSCLNEPGVECLS